MTEITSLDASRRVRVRTIWERVIKTFHIMTVVVLQLYTFVKVRNLHFQSRCILLHVNCMYNNKADLRSASKRKQKVGQEAELHRVSGRVCA